MPHALGQAHPFKHLLTPATRLVDRRIADQQRHAHVFQRAEFGQHAHVGDIRGRGLFRGIELVENRETKSTFAPTKGLAAKIKKEAFNAGLICYPMSGTIDGQHGDHVLLAPAFIIQDKQIDELVTKLATAIKKALQE